MRTQRLCDKFGLLRRQKSRVNSRQNRPAKAGVTTAVRTSEWRNQNLPEGFAFEHRPLHFEEGGETVFREACKLGCEGRRVEAGSPYRSGRSPHWVKVKNPK